MPSYTFKKGERLKSKKIIGRLFNREGSSFAVFPLRVIFLETKLDSPFPAQFTVSVPRRAFKKAVHRNRIRRRIKEAYRLQKDMIYEKLEEKDKQMAIMIVYTAKKPLPYKTIQTKMNLLLEKLGTKC